MLSDVYKDKHQPALFHLLRIDHPRDRFWNLHPLCIPLHPPRYSRMGEPSDESDNWSIEGHFNGRFPTSSFAWTESNPSDWFKQPFLQCESELLPESDSARPTPLGQSQEEDKGKRRYSYSSFEFTNSTPPTSIASSSTFTTVSDTPTILHRDDGARARSESDHSYSRDRECVKPQSRDTGGGGTNSVWQRPITGRAALHSGDPSPLIGRQLSATQHSSDPLRSTRSGYVTKQKPTSRFARMTKTALRACHTLETQPGILLQRAMKNTDPMLFSRLNHDADKYSNSVSSKAQPMPVSHSLLRWLVRRHHRSLNPLGMP